MKTSLAKNAVLAVLVSIAGVSVAKPAHALEEYIRNYRGIRSSGMGGVLVTTGNYGEALFGNPSRISETDTWKATLLDPTLEVNTNLLSSSSELKEMTAASGSGTISSASKLIGKNQHARIQLLPGYYNPKLFGDTGFAFGLLVSAQTNLTVHYTTDLDTQTVVDAGPALAFSHHFLEDALALGFSLRALYRVGTDRTLSSLNFLTGGKLSIENFGQQGVGVDGDLGAYYHIPWEISFMRINVGASINNIAKTQYNLSKVEVIKGAGNSPPGNSRTLSLGTRFDFPDTWIFSAPLFAIEMQDIGPTTKRMSMYKKLHLGGEAKLSRVFSIRGGLNQGYLTAGLGIDLPVVKIDLATYGEELAGNVGEWEDRRYMFRLAFEL